MIESEQPAAANPAEYLNGGFFSDSGQVREGINGSCSLALAYRLRDERVRPEQIRELIDRVDEAVGGKRSFLADDPLPQEVSAALAGLWDAGRSHSSPSVRSLFIAAQPHVTDWKSLAAFALHLQRVLSQLALLAAVTGDLA